MPRTWFITGSSRGVGRVLAETVLASGDLVIATASNPIDLFDLVDRYPDQVRAFALDVTDRHSANAAVKFAVETFGRIDVVAVNNDLWGVGNVTRAVEPILRAQRFGRIVDIATHGQKAQPIDYAASRGADLVAVRGN